jgi:methylated-DNA-protein-cysteine methyltransferase-like protein
MADPRGVDRAVKKKGKSVSQQSRRSTEKPKAPKNISRWAGIDATGAKLDRSATMRMKIEATIRSIPQGKVSTYGAVAEAAGFPGRARQVARVLRRGFNLPWQRVLGAGGQIKCTGEYALEQRFRLEAEGVRFRGRKVDMKAHEFKFGKARRLK